MAHVHLDRIHLRIPTVTTPFARTITFCRKSFGHDLLTEKKQNDVSGREDRRFAQQR